MVPGLISNSVRFVVIIHVPTIYSYLMSERSIDQNIFPEVLGTALCVLLPEGKRTHQAVTSTEGKVLWSID